MALGNVNSKQDTGRDPESFTTAGSDILVARTIGATVSRLPRRWTFWDQGTYIVTLDDDSTVRSLLIQTVPYILDCGNIGKVNAATANNLRFLCLW